MSCSFPAQTHSCLNGGGAWTYNWHLIGLWTTDFDQSGDSETHLYGFSKSDWLTQVSTNHIWKLRSHRSKYWQYGSFIHALVLGLFKADQENLLTKFSLSTSLTSGCNPNHDQPLHGIKMVVQNTHTRGYLSPQTELGCLLLLPQGNLVLE